MGSGMTICLISLPYDCANPLNWSGDHQRQCDAKTQMRTILCGGSFGNNMLLDMQMTMMEEKQFVFIIVNATIRRI